MDKRMTVVLMVGSNPATEMVITKIGGAKAEVRTGIEGAELRVNREEALTLIRKLSEALSAGL